METRGGAGAGAGDFVDGDAHHAVVVDAERPQRGRGSSRPQT